MLETFWRAGVGVVCDETSRLLKMAKESDYVSISPIPNKYCCDDEVGNEMSLPYQGDTISVLNDCFLIFWFRFFYKYQALVENKALKALGDIIKRDYSGVSGLMMERYFTKKFQEEGRYIVGKWWDRKGDNEIDLIVVDIIKKEA